MQLDIERMFSHHPPKNAKTIQSHEDVRTVIRNAAHYFDQVLPDCAEKTLAIRHLQQAMMFANSAIAQYGDSDGSGDRV